VVAVATMAVAAVDNSMPVLLEGLQAADLRQPIPGGTGVADRRLTRHPLTTPGAIVCFTVPRGSNHGRGGGGGLRGGGGRW
jgi:hypothetical protein